MAQLKPVVSIVVPTLNEEEIVPRILGDLREIATPHDVVVADGGSLDGTVAAAVRLGARVIAAPRGRAAQMNAGAADTTGDWLCFLHADSRLPGSARRCLDDLLRDPGAARAAVWNLAIDAPGLWARVVERGAWLRDRVAGLPYGDQGLLVTRELFEEVGGFAPLPIMEDVAMVRALGRRTRLRRLPAPVITSARRWYREGPLRTLARNTVLALAYEAGVPAHRLARWRAPEPLNESP